MNTDKAKWVLIEAILDQKTGEGANYKTENF